MREEEFPFSKLQDVVQKLSENIDAEFIIIENPIIRRHDLPDLVCKSVVLGSIPPEYVDINYKYVNKELLEKRRSTLNNIFLDILQYSIPIGKRTAWETEFVHKIYLEKIILVPAAMNYDVVVRYIHIVEDK